MSGDPVPVPALEMAGIEKRFPAAGGRTVHAVNGVDLTVRPGEIVGLVGESGSGKYTLGRIALGLIPERDGAVRVAGALLRQMSPATLRRHRATMQMVFQDPWSALNPRMTIGALIEEPLKLHRLGTAAERRIAVEEMARRVRLSTAMLGRHAAGLSGGQLQRACIARALITRPKLLVLDEPTSSLDLSVRAGILDLLRDLRASGDVAMLFITHDLGSLKLIADRLVVLYLGNVVEHGPANETFAQPRHPYTRALLSAHLSPDPRQRATPVQLRGEPPSPLTLPKGCAFADRCSLVINACREGRPRLERMQTSFDHRAACIRAHDPIQVNAQA